MRVRILPCKGLIPLLLSSLLIVLCLAGCAEDSSILDNGQSRQLEYSVLTHGWNNSNSSSNTKKDSRATPISGNTFDTSKNFNVIADINKGGNWTTEVDNETASYSTANHIWQTTDTHYWPGAGSTINFYAYYPTSISGSITHTASSVPVLSYTVPDKAADQIDILASSKTSVAGDSYNQTPIDFKHIFAAVNFQVGSNGLPSGTISSITISGIKNSGVYTFGSGWTLNTSTKTFSLSQQKTISGISGEDIYSGTYTLMMIPQTFNNATIILTYNTGTEYTQMISGTWTAGSTYIYNLSNPVTVGDYYYSDGTWGSYDANKTVIGIIFSTSTSSTDKSHGWTHGYAMALQNAGSETATYQWYTSDSGNPTGTYITGADNIMSDKDGYTHSECLQTTGYAAGIAAKGYMAKDRNGNTVATPSGTSGWYLPSIGQWYDICTSLGRMITVSWKAYTYTNDKDWIRWYNGDTSGDINNYSNLCASSINFYQNALKDKGYSIYQFSNNDEYYWCSCEYNSSWAFCVYFSSNSRVGLGGNNKTYSHRVRPVIAF